MEPAGPACVECRRAAILAADFADYSYLIKADEEGMLGRIEANGGVIVDRRIELRIGINLGGVIAEAGEGVNIAARVEAPADHGAVFVSNMVHDQIRNRLKPPRVHCHLRLWRRRTKVKGASG